MNLAPGKCLKRGWAGDIKKDVNWGREFAKLFLLVLIFGGMACGPDGLTSREKEDLEIKKIAEKKRAELAPIVGNYSGTLSLSKEKKKYEIILSVIPITAIVTNPGRTEPQEIPTLGGAIQAYLPNPRRLIPLFSFNGANFESESGSLRLNGVTSNQGGGGGNMFGSITYYLQGFVRGNKITGHIYSTSIGDVGDVSVTRVP